MNLEKQNKSDDDIKKNKFTANNRYFTICIYTMFVIFFGAIIINLITSWNTTLKNIEKGLAVLMPFIAIPRSGEITSVTIKIKNWFSISKYFGIIDCRR